MAKQTNTDFFAIDVTTLVPGKALTFDVYVYLPINERMVLVFRAIEAVVEKEALDRWRGRGLTQFYIHNRDQSAFNSYLAEEMGVPGMPQKAPDAPKAPEAPAQAPVPVAEAAPPAETPKLNDVVFDVGPMPEQAPSPEKPPEPAPSPAVAAAPPPNAEPTPIPVDDTPTEPAKDFATEAKPEELMGAMLKEGKEKEAAVKDAKKMVKDLLNTMSHADESLKEMIDHPAAEHATTVAIYSVLLAMGLGKKDQSLLQDLTLAALMHDVGITQIDPAVLHVPEMKRTDAQKKEFHRHVELGIDLLGELEYKPNRRVLTMLQQHHEKFDGKGYPAGMQSFKIDDWAQVVSFSDLVDSICRGYYDGTERNLGDALRVMAEIEKQTSFPQYFNPDLFRKMMTWLKSGGEDFMGEASQKVEQAKEKMMKAS